MIKPRIVTHQPLSKNKEMQQQEWNSYIENHLMPNGEKKFDVGIVCSFGYMVPSDVIDSFKKGNPSDFDSRKY